MTKISFKTPVRRTLTAAIAVAIAIIYIALSATRLAAAFLGSRAELSSLQMAARLDPGEAEYRYHLGRYYDLVARDPASAVNQYKAAAQINPHSARYWLDLASSYQILGDTRRQTDAIERAIQADAKTPDVAWEAANFYLVQGEKQKALREFSVVIANDNSLQTAALQFCWRIQPDVDALLSNVIPARADAYTVFLDQLMTRQDTAGAEKVWDALTQTKDSFEPKYATSYILYLIKHKEVDPAVLAWQQTASRFGYSSYLPSSGNLVVNGNFSLPLLNAGFDWQYQKQSSVNLTLDPSDFHAGRRSLQIAFDGPGIVDAGIYQFIAVQPSTSYDFSAYYKTGEFDGAGGPHFTVQDMFSQAIYYQSEELKDADFWKSATGEFTTGIDCQLVVLHIRRIPLGSPMRGKLWVGDFHITKKAS